MTMLKAAAETFSVLEYPGASGFNMTSAPVDRVLGPLKGTAVLLDQDGTQYVLICLHMLSHTRFLHQRFCRTVSELLGVPASNVMVVSSHNHSSAKLSQEPSEAFWGEGRTDGESLTSFGKRLFIELARVLRSLPGRLAPVTVEWALGQEGTIAYNCKGRRADGSTYFMREEDRALVAKDFWGDIDRDAPLVCLRREDGQPVAVLVQYAAHPATAYSPENPNVFGEFPQIACDRLSRSYGGPGETPVAFLQGCAGDINSKGLLAGDVKLTVELGQRLGDAYIAASKRPIQSQRQDIAYSRPAVSIPLQPLPSLKQLLSQLEELKDFVARAKAGDEETLECIGLNFPRALSPQYRAALVGEPLKWTQWAIDVHRSGRVSEMPTTVDMEIVVLRLGDVGIVGMPCEPFMGVGREIKKASNVPLTIPCGYTNFSLGYIPDSPNVGDHEYMSAFYLYTKYRPQYAKPGGSAMADVAVETLNRI
jgi:hypothetical protein